MYIWHLEYISCNFSKIEKNRFWKFFVDACINKFGRNSFFRPNIGQILSGTERVPLGPFQKKIFPDNSTFSYSCMILYFDELIWRKPIFSHLGRFGYKKASKIQKFLFFQNLQIYAILSIYTLLGIFLASKKLCQLEARSTPFYLVMDDPIIFLL